MDHQVTLREGLTFDDVLLTPLESNVLPGNVDVCTRATRNIKLSIPLISAAMDTVTEDRLAISMAEAGGIGCIHRNMPIDKQAKAVHRVKTFEAGRVFDPLTLYPDQNLGDARALMDKHGFSGIPIVERQPDGQAGPIVGILTNRDMRFAKDPEQKVSELMTSDNLVTVGPDVTHEESKRLFHHNRLERLIVIDENRHCVGLVTVRDIEHAERFPHAVRDTQGRLRVAAAIGVGKAGIKRAEALIEAGVDILVVDTAHGHSHDVGLTISHIKRLNSQIQIIGGNIATADAASTLIDHGVDAIKVGIGPGSTCTTRIVAGVGVPQFTAICDVVARAQCDNIPVIADGGIRYSGDLAKALAAGAESVMIGSLLAGTDESPGAIHLYEGHPYKYYRGMGSVAAMARGSADRYFQQDVADHLKLVPEGVEGRVPYKGSLASVVHQLMGGLRAAMGYTGSCDLQAFRERARFLRISAAGWREGHPHSLSLAEESSNY